MDNIFSLLSKLLESTEEENSSSSLLNEISEGIIDSMAGENSFSVYKIMDFFEESLTGEVSNPYRMSVVSFLDRTTIHKYEIKAKLGKEVGELVQETLTKFNLSLNLNQRQRVENLLEFLYVFKFAQKDPKPPIVYRYALYCMYSENLVEVVKKLKIRFSITTEEILAVRSLSKKGVKILDPEELFTGDSLDNSHSLDKIMNDLAIKRGVTSEEIREKWIGEISKVRKSKSTYSSFEKWVVKNIYSILYDVISEGKDKISNRIRYRLIFELCIPLYPALYSEDEFLTIKSIRSTYAEYQENTIRAFLK